jgi:lycopene cyclase CruA
MTFLDDLAARYPHTVAAFDAMGALDHVERIERLDAIWDAIRRGEPSAVSDDIYSQLPNPSRNSPLRCACPPTPNSHPPSPNYDLIYAGGGLGLLHAVVMARYGYRVLLFDRGEVGCAHREWNISRDELRALVEVGFCGWDDLYDIIMAEYDSGVVRFYAGPASRRPSCGCRGS